MRNITKTYNSGVTFRIILILVIVASSYRYYQLLKINKLYTKNLIELLNMLNVLNYTERAKI